MQAFLFLLFQSLLVQISWWNEPKRCSSSSGTGHVRISNIPQQSNMHKTFKEIPWSKQRAELLLARWLQQLVWSNGCQQTFKKLQIQVLDMSRSIKNQDLWCKSCQLCQSPSESGQCTLSTTDAPKTLRRDGGGGWLSLICPDERLYF